MARAPTAAAAPADDGDMEDQTDMGGDEAMEGADEGAADTAVVTICKGADGGYTVYAGDEPDEAGEGTAAEEGGEMQEGGEPQGQPATDIGQALHIAMKIMQDDAAQGEGSAQANFQAGFDDQEQVPQEQAPGGG